MWAKQWSAAKPTGNWSFGCPFELLYSSSCTEKGGPPVFQKLDPWRSFFLARALYIVEFIEPVLKGRVLHIIDGPYRHLCFCVERIYSVNVCVLFTRELCLKSYQTYKTFPAKNFSGSRSVLFFSFFSLLHPSRTSVLFFTSEPLRCCRCVARSPLPTLPTPLFIFPGLSTDRPNPQNPPTHMHLFSIHSVPCMRACLHAAMPGWLTTDHRDWLWQVILLTKSDRDWERHRQSRAERMCLLETDANTEEMKKNRTRWRREAWRRSRVEAGRSTEAEIKRETERIECAL